MHSWFFMGQKINDFGHWLINEDVQPFDYFGFVYRITNRKTGRSYIGKKQIIYNRRMKVKGRKNRKHVKKESDWKEYTGSCNELNGDIEILGKEGFKFEILKFCSTKAELGYTETMYQFKEEVLDKKFEDGSRKYYNSNIMNRWFVKKEK